MMNTAHNAFQPVLIWADPPVFDRDVETAIEVVPHLFPKPRPDFHESFVMEIPACADHDWLRCEFFSPQPFEITLDTIIMWGQSKGKRFTGCDPAASGNNRGFEFIMTVGKIYARNKTSLTVVSTNTPTEWRDAWLLLNTTETQQVGANGFGCGLYAGPERLSCSMQYTDAELVGHNVNCSLNVELPFGEDIIFGVGEPPVMYPGMSRSNCFRPLIRFLGNDV